MSERHEDHDERGASADERRGVGLWRGVLVIGSVLLMAAGVALPFVITGESPEAEVALPADASAPGDLALPFGPAGEASDPEALESVGMPADSAPVVFRLGFSFFVGFSIAYAARRFLRLAIVFAGFVFLLLFGLQYAQIIHVDWQVFETHYDSASGWLRDQTSSFGRFITGYLPSTALAAFGLVVGFRSS